MKHLTLITVLLAAVSLAALPARAQIVLRQTTPIVIEQRGPAALQFPAGLLDKYLRLALRRNDLRAPGNPGSPGPSGGAPVTFIIEAEARVWHELPRDAQRGLGDLDAFTVTISDAPAPVVHVQGGTVYAATCGVMNLLEQDIGITWLFPGELGVALPDAGALPLTLRPGRRRVAPDVISRLYTGVRYADPQIMIAFRQRYRDTPLFDERHFFEAYDYFKSMGLHFLASPSHNMIHIFDTRNTPQQYPHLMPMLEDGSRFVPPEKDAKGREFQSWHPCYTHPDAVKVTAALARQAFDSGTLCFSLGINDGKRVQCQCETCRAAGWPMSYYRYVSAVAEALKDRYPPHLLGVLVYGDVRQPADNMKLPDNVLCMVSGASPFRKWSSHAAHLGRYDWAYGDGFIVPTFPLAAMKHNAGRMKQYGVKAYRAEVHPVWAFDAPKIYLLSRMLWDLDADLDALLARWCQAAFGPGGEAMQRFYQRMAALSDELRERAPEGEFAPMCDMRAWRSSSPQFRRVSADDMAYAAACVEEAGAKITDPLHAARLDMVRTYFEQTRALFEMFRLAQDTFAGGAAGQDLARSSRSIHALRQRAGELALKIEKHPEWQTGAGTVKDTQFSVANEARSAILTALLSLREAGKLSAQQIAALPADLQQYATGTIAPARQAVPRAMDKGTYYAGQHLTHLYAPMFCEVQGDTLRARTNAGPMPRVGEGPTAGQFKEHWAFALVPHKGQAGARLLYRLDITATGQAGAVSLVLTNPIPEQAGEGLPVTVEIAFDKQQATQTRSLIIEPIASDSEWRSKPFSYRLNMLFAPSVEDAHCEVTMKVTPLTMPVPEAR